MAANETTHKKEHILGSGHLRVYEIDDKDIPKTEDEWVEFLNDFIREHDVLGRVKGGASLDYTTEKTEDQDDLGYVIIEIIKKEKVELKSGVMTWDGETLEKLCATARVTTDPETGITTIKIDNASYYDKRKRRISVRKYKRRCFRNVKNIL